MDKGVPPSLFVNDGSFMERFKRIQEGKEKIEDSKPKSVVSGTLTSNPLISKTSRDCKGSDSCKTTNVASGGKLAFSLKQKSKLLAHPVKLGADEDEDEIDARNVSVDTLAKRQKLGHLDASEQLSKQVDGVPPSPVDSIVKNVADKLASFVAKHGRQIEHVTRQKNPGDTPFKFLFDDGCSDYKYYEYRLAEEEKALSQVQNSQMSNSGGTSTSASKSTSVSQRPLQQNSNYQNPASALFEAAGNSRASINSVRTASAGGTVESSGPTGADPIAMMEFYMKKAAHEEKRRQPKHSMDEMPPPASLQAGPGKKGHHMGDYIPQEELEKFMATCNDAAAQKAARETAEREKIQADNVGHKLLSKMGWKEGEGLGSSRNGIADPIRAGNVKMDNLGVGAQNPGEVTSEDDIYEQYKKRMMLGYRYRPNPLNNPRKSYY